MEATEKAARIWMQREYFMLVTPWSFTGDTCSGDIPNNPEQLAKVYRIVADTLKRQEQNYRAAIADVLGDAPMPWCEVCQGYHHSTASCIVKGHV
jgi:hypothetical protein